MSLLTCLALGATAQIAAAGLLARVEPSWSPFYRSAAPVEIANLVSESRDLLTSNPTRVLQILAQAQPREGNAARLLQGLRADAAYQVGGTTLQDARRLYRALAAASPDPEQQAWALFMEASILQGLGLGQEAAAAYARARAWEGGPWSPALEFNAAVLLLESARYGEAREALTAWLASHPRQPGRDLVLYLAGECAARGNDPERALALFAEARRGAPLAWTVRPQSGHLLADLLVEQGRVPAAVELMEDLAAAAPGTEAASGALLRAGTLWADVGRIADAAKSYARLIDLGPTPAEGREARLRLALLGVEYADQTDLNEPYPAYRLFYRPRPTLEEFVAGRDPTAAQRALLGLATLEERAGRLPDSLALLARAFRAYPESTRSGLAYERYMDLLERHLTDQLRQGATLAVVDHYLVARPAIGWAPTRDTGPVQLLAARAYELLGAPAEARTVYQRVRSGGTRTLTPEQLDERILYTQVLERDPDALRRWVSGHPRDRSAHLELARSLVRQEKLDEAKVFFRRAETLSATDAERLDARAQAQRLDALTADASVMLEQLRQRQDLWRRLPDGPERRAWSAADALTGARLQFATDDYAGAAEGLADISERSAADTYWLAAAQLRRNRWTEAAPLLQQLAAGGDPVYRDLAAVRQRTVELTRQARRSL